MSSFFEILKKLKKNTTRDLFLCGLTPSENIHAGGIFELTFPLFFSKFFENSKVVCLLDDCDPLKKIPRSFPHLEKSELFKPLNLVFLKSGESVAEHFSKKIIFLSNLTLKYGIYFNFCSEIYFKYLTPSKLEELFIFFKKKRKTIISLQKKYLLYKPRQNFFSSIFSIVCEFCSKKQFKFKKKKKILCVYCKKEFFFKYSLCFLKWRYYVVFRWRLYKPLCEFAGKDHLSELGSFNFAKAFLQKIYKEKPPFFFQFEFFLTDSGKKLSKSKDWAIKKWDALSVFPASLIPTYFLSFSFNSEKKETKDSVLSYFKNLLLQIDSSLKKSTKQKKNLFFFYACKFFFPFSFLKNVSSLNLATLLFFSKVLTTKHKFEILLGRTICSKTEEMFFFDFLQGLTAWNDYFCVYPVWVKTKLKKIKSSSFEFFCLLKNLFFSLSKSPWTLVSLKKILFWKTNSFLSSRKELLKELYLLFLNSPTGPRLETVLLLLGQEVTLEILKKNINETAKKNL